MNCGCSYGVMCYKHRHDYRVATTPKPHNTLTIHYEGFNTHHLSSERTFITIDGQSLTVHHGEITLGLTVQQKADMERKKIKEQIQSIIDKLNKNCFVRAQLDDVANTIGTHDICLSQ